MEYTLNGITFKKIDDEKIGVYLNDGSFFKEIDYPAATEQQLADSANFYYVHCY